MLLAKIVSSFEYSCEAFLFLPDKKFETAGIFCIRPSLHCTMKTEVLYYGSDIDRADNAAIVDREQRCCEPRAETRAEDRAPNVQTVP